MTFSVRISSSNHILNLVHFSVIAGEPVPVDVLFQLLKIDDDQKKEAKEQGKMPKARLEQLEEAMYSKSTLYLCFF